MSDFLSPHIRRPAIRWTPGDALPPVEATGPAAPLLIDKNTGRLLVDIPSFTDPATTNGLLTSIQADLAAPLTITVPGFSIPPYNYIACSYTGSNLTQVVYKTSATGSTVATLTLAYDGSGNITSVTKS